MFEQNERFHPIGMLKRSLVSDDERVPSNRSSRSLLYTSTLQFAGMHVAKPVMQHLERCLRLVKRSRLTPFIRSFVVKLLVASGIDVFNRRVQRRLCARGHAIAARALIACNES